MLTLSDDANTSCTAVDTIPRAHLAEIVPKIAVFMAIRTELDRVIDSCRQGTVADYKIIETIAPTCND